MSAVATIKDFSGNTYVFDKCVGFSFFTQRYSPSSEFYGKFYASEIVTDIASVTIAINGVIVQRGFICSATYERNSKGLFFVLRSRPFSALLEQNHVKPAMYTSMTMSKIHSNLVEFSGVSVEASSTAINYIVVKDNATVWDCYVQLCLKLWGVLPYVTAQNQVRFSLHTPYVEVVLPSSKVVSTAKGVNVEDVISNVHMRDTNGEYDVYCASSSAISNYGITRRRHIGWDQAWLASVQTGLKHRLDYSARGIKASYVTYLGYSGEQVYDRVKMSEAIGDFRLDDAKISSVKIIGNSSGIRTTLCCYDDYYMGVTK